CGRRIVLSPVQCTGAVRIETFVRRPSSSAKRCLVSCSRSVNDPSQETMIMNVFLRAFHGDPKIKAKYLGRAQEHAKADALMRDSSLGFGKGCAVGRTLDVNDHKNYP